VLRLQAGGIDWRVDDGRALGVELVVVRASEDVEKVMEV